MFLNDILYMMMLEIFENIFSVDIKVLKFRFYGCNMYLGVDLEEGGVGWVWIFFFLEKLNVLNKCIL